MSRMGRIVEPHARAGSPIHPTGNRSGTKEEPVPSEAWVVRADGAAIVILRGDVDVASSHEAAAALRRAAGIASTTLLVDLEDVSFIDATGVTALIQGRRLAAELGLRYVLVAPSEAVTRLLTLLQLHPVFTIETTLQSALAQDELVLRMETEARTPDRGGSSSGPLQPYDSLSPA